MAWVDDRVWAHPKFTDLSAPAFRCYVYGLCYSSGFNTRGYLTEGQVATLGAKPSLKRELIDAGLWETRGKLILIHDWDDHNAKRDERRAADRERKRLDRLRKHGDIPPDDPADVPADTPEEVPQDAPSFKSTDGMTVDVERSKPTPLQRPRDEIWDALAELFGKVAAKTNGHARRNKAAADLRRQDATADDVKLAARVWPRLFPQATLTDIALATHYTQLLTSTGRKPGQQQAKPCPECGLGAGQHLATCPLKGVGRGTPASTAA